MRKTSLSVMLLAVSLLGAGCFGKSGPSGTADGPPAGPKPATFESLSPAEAAKKIQFTAGSIIMMKQSFSGSGAEIASKLGWGKELTREIAIARFAPKNITDVSWKSMTNVGTTTKQFVGTIAGANLQSSPDVLVPSFWMEGEQPSIGSSLIWLSSDTFENQAKAKSGTLRFALDNMSEYSAFSGSAFGKGLAALQAEAKKAIEKKDIYLATAGDLTTMKLEVNGKEVEVEVLPIHSWFGDFTVLNNPENPIILEYKSTLPEKTLDGFLDFQVTGFKDLQE